MTDTTSKPSSSSIPAITLRAMAQLLADMQAANARVNASANAVDYQVACVGLALVTRQFLREFNGAACEAGAQAWEIVAKLAAAEPTWPNDGRRVCRFCAFGRGEHAPDCLWVRAKTVVEGR